MVRLFVVPIVLMLFAIAYSQDNEKPAFETADVRISSQHLIPVMTGGVLRNGRYALQNATMLDLIRAAYNTEDDRIVGGPTWLETARFDVIAKVPVGTAPNINLMLQTLLAERFGLSVHNGTKSMQAYVLTVGKSGPKMTRAAVQEKGGCEGQPQATPTAGVAPLVVVSCHGLQAADIAQYLHQMAGRYVGDHPLVDETKLEDFWDFDLKWTDRNQVAIAGADAITISDAVDKQLGLKLALRTSPVPVIIVDNVNEKPTDNPPGVAELLPPDPTEFEVAVVKPSAPEVKEPNGRNLAGGRIDIRGYTLKMLMTDAWGIQSNIADDLFAGAPSWFDSARFDVVARAAGSGSSRADELPADPEALMAMFRNLLVEKFKLKIHTENRDATVYALAPKGEPKLKKADTGDRAGCKRGPGPPNPNGTSTVMETCLNTTMADVAKYLPQWASGSIDHPVVDATGMTGGWNFILTWTGRAQLLGSLAPTSSSGAGLSAVDPGGMSVFEAVEKQLGFKLERQKRGIPVIVIDHAEMPQP